MLSSFLSDARFEPASEPEDAPEWTRERTSVGDLERNLEYEGGTALICVLDLDLQLRGLRKGLPSVSEAFLWTRPDREGDCL